MGCVSFFVKQKNEQEFAREFLLVNFLALNFRFRHTHADEAGVPPTLPDELQTSSRRRPVQAAAKIPKPRNTLKTRNTRIASRCLLPAAKMNSRELLTGLCNVNQLQMLQSRCVPVPIRDIFDIELRTEAAYSHHFSGAYPFGAFLFTQNGHTVNRFAIGNCRNSHKTAVSRDSDASSRFRAAAGQSTSAASLSLRKMLSVMDGCGITTMRGK